MKKNLTIVLSLAMTLGLLAGFNFGASAQTRHVMLEEFTGAWCGYCPRGAYAERVLDAKYPGKVFTASIHAQNGDPMENAQGDSLVAGIPGLANTGLTGFPDGWTARTAFDVTLQDGSTISTLNVDPSDWTDINTAFPGGLGANPSPSYADSMVTQNAQATASIDNLTFNSATHMVSVTASATFVSALTGDFRLSIYVTEDSVTGGTNYDQASYYYATAGNPLQGVGKPVAGRSYESMIPNWEHMHVFREAVSGVWGTAGVIPATPVVGTRYTKTFTFLLPTSVMNPNHTNIIAFVNEFSTTDITKNQIFDAAQSKLSASPIKIGKLQATISPNDGQYLWAKANGDTTEVLTIIGGSSATPVALSVDSHSLPTGWTVSISPSNVTVPANGSSSATLTIHAPDHSAYAGFVVTAIPQTDGEFSQATLMTINALSDNTRYVYYLSPSGSEVSAYTGLPDSMKTHTSLMPSTNEVLNNYPAKDFTLGIFGDDKMLDNDGTGTFSTPPTIQAIDDLLAAGKKVFISTDDAMYWALSGQPNAAHATTVASKAFFKDTLGLTYRALASHVNSNGYIPFSIQGTNDPIGKGVNVGANAQGALAGSDASVVFDIKSPKKSDTLFTYQLGSGTYPIGVKYQSGSGARLVYLGFILNALTDQAIASTIYKRSIDWLFGLTPNAVGTIAESSTMMSAFPNPFRGQTEIRYTAKSGENNITFSVMNVLGQEVAILPASNAGANTFTAMFNASKLAGGAYTIIAHSSTGVHQVKVISEQ